MITDAQLKSVGSLGMELISVDCVLINSRQDRNDADHQRKFGDKRNNKN